jgi:inositol transport system ATP-binding protein
MPQELLRNREQDAGSDRSEPYLLEVVRVSKSFPGVVALDQVGLRIRPGTVHALMGENGAGKSTLMKIIAGVLAPDAGEIRMNGSSVRFDSPRDALDAGIAMIYQELNLMPHMTVAENIWIRREPLRGMGLLIDHAAMRRMTQQLFRRLNVDLDPDEEVGNLTIANRQLVEIAKAVSFDSAVLIMDEPTSALTEREVLHLFAIIKDLKSHGVGIIYITHKMDEVFSISDEVSVLRDGRFIANHLCADADRASLIREMVGRDIGELFPKEAAVIGEQILLVENLSLRGKFTDVSLALRKGEILGIGGLVGAGRSSVAKALFGVTPASSGRIVVRGEPTVIDSPATAVRCGMAFVTEDRQQTGCFLSLSVLENMEIAVLRSRYAEWGLVTQTALTGECERLRQVLRIKVTDLQECIQNLSGGNQQKVLLGRWLLTDPGILILDEPTRGIDVGSKAEIHKLISRLAATGVGVILISSEMAELLGMCDRIIVMHEGRMTGTLERSEADQLKIMHLASGERTIN